MNRLIRYAGVMFAFFITINFYVIMIVAMLNNNVVTVYFNHFGEAIVEYIMYFALAPIIAYSYIYEVIKFRRKKNAKKKHAKNYTENIN